MRPSLTKVRWNKTPDQATTFTHMCLVVTTPDMGANYLVDVGFGGIGPMAPVCVDTPVASQQVDGAYRVVPVPDDQLLLQGNFNNYRGMWIATQSTKLCWYGVLCPKCA